MVVLVMGGMCGIVYLDLLSIGAPICNDLEIWVCSGLFFFLYMGCWCYIVGGKYRNLLQLVGVIFFLSSVGLLVMLIQFYQVAVGLNGSILVNSLYFIVNRVLCLFLMLNGCGEVVVPNAELMAELMKFSLVDHSSNSVLVLQLSDESVGEYLAVGEESDEDEGVEKFSMVPGYEAFGFIVILNILIHCCKFAPYVAPIIAPVVAPIVGPAVVPIVAVAAVAVAVVAVPVVPPVPVDMFLDFMEFEVQR